MDYKEYLHLDNVFTSPFRSVAWSLVKGLMSLLESAQQIVLDVFDFSGIFQNEFMQEFLTTYSNVAWTIGTLALVFWGLRYMYDDKVKIKTMFDSFLLGIGTLLLGTLIIGKVTTVGIQISESFLTNDQNNSFAFEVLNSNTTDMYRVLNDGVQPEQAHANVNETNIHFIDINETIKKDDLNDKVTQKAMEHKVHMQSDGSLSLKKINDYLFIGIEQNYTRYLFNGWVIIFFLATSILAYILTAFKFVQLMFEIVFNQTLLPLFAFSDLNGAKILKMILNNIKNAIISMVMISMVLKAYSIAQLFIVTLDISVFTQILIQFALALSVIDGPKIAQDVTGNDAGIKSTGLAMFGIAKGAGSAISGLSKGASAIGSVGKSVGSKAMSLGVGMNNLKHDNEAINASSTQAKSSSNGSPNDRDKDVQSEMNKGAWGAHQTVSGNNTPADSSSNNLQSTKPSDGVPLSDNQKINASQSSSGLKTPTQSGTEQAKKSDFVSALNNGKQDRGNTNSTEKPLRNQPHLQTNDDKTFSNNDSNLSQSAKRSIGSSPNAPIAPNLSQEMESGKQTSQLINQNQIPKSNLNSKSDKNMQQDTTATQADHSNRMGSGQQTSQPINQNQIPNSNLNTKSDSTMQQDTATTQANQSHRMASGKQLNSNDKKGNEEKNKLNDLGSGTKDERNI
ncbi:hypothetical protein FEZ33_00460 [Ruoffia tabacinasalis]|uniref:DUF8208 domain-containing protein n=1 Tax=Ruoffia tabacinasalis TaxID=87458 RepID=A0A5R9EK83_9LACT|nr:hypothetical protein [Ruoffia tabacinasalis]TLQ49493.1 hypothetical protein FEZ33_00460 [Ruoffia tabacinasalis]